MHVGRPTEKEVIYDHIDIKLHPLAVQLNDAIVSGITTFFSIKDVDRRDDKALCEAYGLPVTTSKAGAEVNSRTCLHALEKPCTLQKLFICIMYNIHYSNQSI